MSTFTSVNPLAVFIIKIKLTFLISEMALQTFTFHQLSSPNYLHNSERPYASDPINRMRALMPPGITIKKTGSSSSVELPILKSPTINTLRQIKPPIKTGITDEAAKPIPPNISVGSNRKNIK
jgi:hypothetical protein